MNGLLLGAVILAAAMLTAGAALWRDVSAQRLRDRIAALRDPVAQPKELAVGSIRRVQVSHSTWTRRLFRLVAYDPDNRGQRALPWPALVLIAAGAGVATFWLARGKLGMLPGAAAGLAAAAATARIVLMLLKRRYADQLLKQLPDAIGLIVRGATVGVPVPEAIRVIAAEASEPTAGEFSMAAREIAIGTPVEAAIQQIYRRTGLTEYAFLAVTTGLQQRSGGNFSETLENLADIIRKRIVMAGRAKALSGEARMSAMILTILPFAAGLLMSVEQPGYLSPLFDTPTGETLQKVFIGMMAGGLLVIRQLIQRAMRG